MYKHTNITISRNFFKKVVTNTRQTTLTKQKLLSGVKIGGVLSMTFLIVCVVASIIWGAILICKIVDVIHITDVNKLSECKIILVVSMSGLTLSWWLFFMDLINIIGY